MHSADFWKHHFAIASSSEIPIIDAFGKLINSPCYHKLIPGLDADFCSECRRWWVDQQQRDRLAPSKSQEKR